VYLWLKDTEWKYFKIARAANWIQDEYKTVALHLFAAQVWAVTMRGVSSVVGWSEDASQA
jgi:hypothetical protein